MSARHLCKHCKQSTFRHPSSPVLASGRFHVTRLWNRLTASDARKRRADDGRCCWHRRRRDARMANEETGVLVQWSRWGTEVGTIPASKLGIKGPDIESIHFLEQAFRKVMWNTCMRLGKASWPHHHTYKDIELAERIDRYATGWAHQTSSHCSGRD